MRVLVCEDESATRFVISRVLTNGECDVTDCANGAEALRLLKRDRFDAVFLDLEMPLLNGIEVLEQLRGAEATRHLPVIVLSAERRAEVIERLLQLGINGYIVKPPQRASLLKHVNDLKRSLVPADPTQH